MARLQRALAQCHDMVVRRSAVLEALALTPKPTCLIGVEDAFGQSAQSHGELLAHYGLTTEAICERARFLMGRG